MSNTIIVIIGGPGSGKTTVIEALTQSGYTCYPEVSREVTLQARQQGIEQLFLEQPLLFSELLLEGRIKQYNNAVADAAPVVFIDRGIPDVLAYMHYIGNSYPSGFDQACKDYVYSKIFYLPPWEAIYTPDDARYENYEQAVLIAHHLQETYVHYGYNLVEVPHDTPQNRVAFILNNLT